ncbi:MAG: flagellar hook-basal body complex protein FliE [Caulobacter sp.]|nr:flagellar hook-basal body complex protein FliE [Caulobacter sp.]
MITALAAAKAYAATQKTGGIPGADGGAVPGASFQDLLKNVMGDAMQSSKAAETQMAAHVQGKGQLIDVVTAISSAEASLETVMAVRDQVISAYQEIMRMPI